jgi:hypothetical protein
MSVRCAGCCASPSTARRRSWKVRAPTCPLPSGEGPTETLADFAQQHSSLPSPSTQSRHYQPIPISVRCVVTMCAGLSPHGGAGEGATQTEQELAMAVKERSRAPPPSAAISGEGEVLEIHFTSTAKSTSSKQAKSTSSKQDQSIEMGVAFTVESNLFDALFAPPPPPAPVVEVRALAPPQSLAKNQSASALGVRLRKSPGYLTGSESTCGFACGGAGCCRAGACGCSRW